jgi:hypothetical protein
VNVTHPSKLLPDIDTHTDDSYGIVARVDFTRLFYEFVAGTKDVQAGFDVADGENADGENVQRVEWIAQVYVANFARHSGPVLLLPIMRGWDLLVRLLQQQKAEGMGDALFHTSEDWVLAVLEQEFIDGTVTACLVAVLCASASVAVFIGNMTICIALVFAVCGILVSVASTLVAMGVKFGVIEALSLSITVGLSVDYIIHLAHAYNVCTASTRKLKSQSMLEIRAKSVCDSAASSVCSICFLFACQVPLLNSFARVFALLIVYSLVWSLLGFTAALMVFGPERTSALSADIGGMLTRHSPKIVRKMKTTQESVTRIGESIDSSIGAGAGAAGAGRGRG